MHINLCGCVVGCEFVVSFGVWWNNSGVYIGRWCAKLQAMKATYWFVVILQNRCHARNSTATATQTVTDKVA
jgi:hypothetical protein